MSTLDLTQPSSPSERFEHITLEGEDETQMINESYATDVAAQPEAATQSMNQTIPDEDVEESQARTESEKKDASTAERQLGRASFPTSRVQKILKADEVRRNGVYI